MPSTLVNRADSNTVPLTPLAAKAFDAWLKKQPKALAAWTRSAGFAAKAGTLCLVQGKDGGLERVLAGVEPEDGPWALAGLPAALPKGRYRIDPPPSEEEATSAALGWALGSYSFDRYRKAPADFAALVWPKGADKAAVSRAAEATTLVREEMSALLNEYAATESGESAAAVR